MSTKLLKTHPPKLHSGYVQLLDELGVPFLLLEKVHDTPGDSDNFHFLFANKAFKTLSGLPGEEVIGKTPWKIWPKEKEKWTSLFNEVITTGVFRKLGQPWKTFGKYFEITAFSPEENQLALSFKDITTDIESEQHYHKLIQKSPDAIVVTDLRGKISFASAKALSLFGHKPEDVSLGLNVLDFISEEEHGKATDNVRKIIQGEKPEHIYFQVNSKGGDSFFVEINSETLANKSGKPENALLLIRDVTERIKAEKALQESESRHRLISEAISDYYYEVLLGTEGNIYLNWFSGAYEKITGYTQEEVNQLPNTWLSVVHPDDISTKFQKVLDSIQQNKSGRFEYRIINKIGKVKWIRENIKPVWSKQEQRAVKVIGASTDVTQQKLAEEALKESEARFRRLVENAPEIIFRYRVQPDLRYEYISPTVEKITGYSLHSHYQIQQLWGQIMHPDDRERIQLSFETGEAFKAPSVFRITRKDGKLIHLEQHVVPVYDEDGNLEAIEGIIRDITNRIETEKKREESERRFRLLAENIDGAFWLRTVDKMIFISKGYEKIWGRSCQSLYKNADGFVEDIHPEDKERVYKAHLEDKSGGKPFDEIYRILTPKGELKWVWSKAFDVSEMGDSNLFAGIAYDVTELKLKEKQLREAKDKAEENDKLKTAFLANMSHEIRTPMNGIMGFAELLTESGIQETERKEYAGFIMESCERLLTLLNGILDISKIETGQIGIHKEQFDLNLVLNEATTLFEQAAREKDIQIFVSKKLPEQQKHIITDKRKVQQILTNLVHNAVKFTEQGQVEIGVSAENGFLAFFVRDTGIGIPFDLHKEIFIRFRQVESSFKQQYGGTGLGLAISKAYIQLLGGQIWLQSEEGKGSTFYFTIAYENAANNEYISQKHTRPKGHPLDLKNKTILIAEDEQVNYRFLHRLLSATNANILRAEQGHEAVQLTKLHPEINLVLMDIKMPGLDGYEATKQIKDFRNNLPVIAQTAFAMADERERIMQAGFDGYITKPVKRTVLFQLVESLLRKPKT